VPKPLASRKASLIASRIPLADLVSRGLEELIEAKSVTLKVFVSPHLV